MFVLIFKVYINNYNTGIYLYRFNNIICNELLDTDIIPFQVCISIIAMYSVYIYYKLFILQ